MLFVALTAILLGLLGALLARRSHVLNRAHLRLDELRNVDLAAFQNLMRSHDDLFLRESLSRKSYRIAKRAKTRALQQYLLWIAGDCAIIQAIVHSPNYDSDDDRRVRRELSTIAFNLRLISLLLWSGLWLEWALPNLDLLPESVFTTFENSVIQVRNRFAQSLSNAA